MNEFAKYVNGAAIKAGHKFEVDHIEHRVIFTVGRDHTVEFIHGGTFTLVSEWDTYDEIKTVTVDAPVSWFGMVRMIFEIVESSVKSHAEVWVIRRGGAE